MDIHDLKYVNFNITLTAPAAAQILLLLNNDYTLENSYPRLAIKGKGCNGFDYAISFTQKLPDDLWVNTNYDIKILLDTFTAKFVKDGTLDFIQSHEDEGFHFKNNHENLFHGKFYKDLEFQDI